MIDRPKLPHGAGGERALVGFIKGSNAVGAAFGSPAALPEDPLDAVIGGVAQAFSEKRQPTSLVGKLKAAAQPAEEAPKMEKTLSAEDVADVESLTGYLGFLDDLREGGQLTEAEYVEQYEDTTSELAKLTGQSA